ncbi:unannotated protein [freshwater metagenome]|uniref:Unannotated protein n=1 Tax=freshwater metagenome TaxID=449393 RepID=A0A6J7JGB5_9ZZZZ
MGRRALSLVLVLMLATFQLGQISSNADLIPDEQFDGLGNGYQYGTPGNGYLSMWFTDSDIKPMPPAITAFTPTSGSSFPKKCESLSDPVCLSEKFIEVYTQYPSCKNANLRNCLSDVWAIDQSGKKHQGVFVRSIKGLEKPLFEENIENAIPQSSLPQVVRFPTLVGLENQDFLVTATMKGVRQVSNNFDDPGKQLEVFIHAVNIAPASVKLEAGATNWIKFAVDNKQFNSCVAIGDGECAKPIMLPQGIRYGLKLKTSRNIARWLESRTRNPIVSVERNASDYFTTLEGESVLVPSISGGGEFTSLPVEIRNRYPEADPSKSSSHITWGMSSASQGTTTLNDLKIWLPFLGERATVMPSAWSFRSLGVVASYQLTTSPYRECAEKSSTILLGIVSSNATAFSSGPPVFNSESVSLDYQIAAPHLTSKGETFIGSYSLIMNSAFARCIYSLTNAPVKATVSVINTDGKKQIATEAFYESGGWIRLSAEGFTFSSPTVRIKLVQDPGPAMSNDNASKPMAQKPSTIQKKQTISCKKGKVTKKVTGINPKCPIGFKIK